MRCEGDDKNDNGYDIGHDIWQDILAFIAKRRDWLNASCQYEYRQTVEYVSTDRLVLDLTHQVRFNKIEDFSKYNRLYTGFLCWTKDPMRI